jgi:hypothetical protein
MQPEGSLPCSQDLAVVVAYFMVLSYHLPVGNEGNNEIPCSADRDSNPGISNTKQDC